MVKNNQAKQKPNQINVLWIVIHSEMKWIGASSVLLLIFNVVYSFLTLPHTYVYLLEFLVANP